MTLRVAVPQFTSSAERLAKVIPDEFKVDRYFPKVTDVMLFGPRCRVEGCEGSRVLQANLCFGHLRRAHSIHSRETTSTARRLSTRNAADRAWLDAFVADLQQHGGPFGYNHTGFDFTRLHPQLADQLRFYLYLRRELNTQWVRQHDFARIRASGLQAQPAATSLFEREQEEALAFLRRNEVLRPPAWLLATQKSTVAVVRFIKENVARLCYSVPRAERDYWQQIDFGLSPNPASYNGPISFLNFKLAWFRDWAKQFVEHQLKVGVKWSSVQTSAILLQRLDMQLRKYSGKLSSVSDIDRNVIEFLYEEINLRSDYSKNFKRNILYALCAIINIHREQDWEPPLRRGVLMRLSELPELPPPLPRPIDPFVLAQLLRPEHLERMHPYLRSAIVIGRHHGLRISSLITLENNPVYYTDGGPNLRYFNIKLNRPASQPIMKQDVLSAIEAQRRLVREQFRQDTRWLYPALTRNLAGTKHLTDSMLNQWLRDAVRKLDIVERDGQPADLQWGHFRDTFATELLDAGIPPHAVAVLLDHTDTRSLEAYARRSADATRKMLVATPRYNHQGEQLPSTYADAEAVDVEYMRDSIRLASVTVPNGYCTLPVREECPHLNACYSCPSDAFVTTPNHLPGHLTQLEETQMLIVSSEQRGQQRMVQKNRVTERHLQRIIASLLEWTATHPEDVQGTALEGFLLKNASQLDAIRDAARTHDQETP